MKLRVLSLIFFLLTLFGYSQTADQIIKKHLEVTGGVNGWKNFNTVILKGDMVLGINEGYPIEIYQQRPNLNKTVMIAEGKKVILNGYNGKKAVKFNFQTNKIEVDRDYVPETFDSDLLEYANKGFKVELLGTEKVNAIDCYKIKLIKNSNINTYYFDNKNYQLIRETNAEETKTYSDFKKTSGLTFPFKIEIKSIDNQSDVVLIFKTIEVNKVISPKEFSF